ncbi:MAG: hypothetical protein IPN29_14540 [Saprospiraceae bacterium]|nr:hypothetical protein [Saprospiraceae bacterium]
MNPYFAHLTEAEYQQLKDALALITIYIAGADGEVQHEETEWAEKVAEIRSYKMSEDLLGFYKELNVDFHDKIMNFISALPRDTVKRNDEIERLLTELNPIMAKLELHVGAHLYKSYVSFARHVAKATGGFLGFFAISPKEKAIMGLKMLTPIISDDEEE